MHSLTDPEAEYRSRIEARQESCDRLAGTDRLLSAIRVAIALGGVAVAWGAWGPGWLSAGWLFPVAAAFVAVALYHERVAADMAHSRSAVALYRQGLERLAGKWPGHGVPGNEYGEAAHVYQADLDLFGEGSLFELLCRARTESGRGTLAAWLSSPAPLDEIRARQVAVDELRSRLDLREEIALLGGDVDHSIHASKLRAWGTAPAVGLGPRERWVALGLGVLTAVTGVAWAVGFGPLPFAFFVFAEIAFAATQGERVGRIVAGTELPARELGLLVALLRRLESETFTSPKLVALQAALATEGVVLSRRIAELRRLVDLLDSARNPFFALFAMLMLWTTQVAMAIERWRVDHGRQMGDWLDAVGAFEALSSFAGHAYEHPEDPFPELVAAGPVLDGVGLGHPMIPEERAIRNDVRLDADTRLFLVSGSNMSGKSTLLRTIGVNTVLAMAGAPVRATSLRIGSLTVGASIRVQDSLLSGESRFYAEISRLRAVMDLADGDATLLYLLDEILHGTNSHDRRIGAEAIVKALVDRGAIGLVTTHDLALARIADELAPAARNVHFEDRLDGDRMTFDYRLRDGVVEHSNALALMRSIGLLV